MNILRSTIQLNRVRARNFCIISTKDKLIDSSNKDLSIIKDEVRLMRTLMTMWIGFNLGQTITSLLF